MDKVRATSKKINQTGDQQAAAEPKHEARPQKPDPQPVQVQVPVPTPASAAAAAAAQREQAAKDDAAEEARKAEAAAHVAPMTIPAHMPEPETHLDPSPATTTEHGEKKPAPPDDEPPPVQTPNPISGT